MATDPNSTATAPWLIDRREASRLLGVCPNTVSNLQRQGELAPVRIGSRVLFDRRDLLAFIQSRKALAAVSCSRGRTRDQEGGLE